MSGYLWKYYLEDNVESFRHLLETSAYNARPGAQRGLSQGAALGSPGSLSTSPTYTKTKRPSVPQGVPLSRLDINSRDNLGLTILHHAASSSNESALAFAEALLEHPLTDLYTQDYENGWTSLHRAFYFGNVAIAKAIIERDRRFVPGRPSNTANQQAGGLVKIKDKEGSGPFDLFAMTIQDRILHAGQDDDSDANEAEDEDTGSNGDHEDGLGFRGTVRPLVSLHGDELYTFGSNKNITLGFGDEDDRQYPEKIVLRRPDRLLQRFRREHEENYKRAQVALGSGPRDERSPAPVAVTGLPTVIRNIPLLIQDVQMSKLHTAVLTTDPESNLYICGHGTGGRLGTGSETTRFQFVCLEGGVLSGKRIVGVALGQNHTLAVSSDGEIYSWGSNLNGQLGYSLPRSSVKDEEPVQTVPRQIFGVLKKELVVGIAASRNHSVVHTSTSLYTFGKNEGQLGIMDSDARSLDIQITPRKVAASLFSSSIHSVSAIERATICLLENHDVWVFANYGYSKITFPLDGFANYFLKSSFLATKYEKTPNRINKITAGGDTICALSSSGEIFTVSMSKKADAALDSSASTTNPTKIRSALSVPQCIWSAKKRHMAAKDVGVDQDGSIILVTEAGGVWRRTKRASMKDATASGTGEYKPKDYKFSRIPGLTRVSAVRSSSYGAYAAIRKDSDVTRTQIDVQGPDLWAHMAPLLSFGDLARSHEDSDDEDPTPRFWTRPTEIQRLQRRVLASKDLATDVRNAMQRKALDVNITGYDMEICTTSCEVRIAAHQFMVAARSSILRQAIPQLKHNRQFVISDGLRLETQDDGKLLLTIESLDFLTVFNLVLYIYTDTVVPFGQHARHISKHAERSRRETRQELYNLARRLDMRQLESSSRLIVTPKRTMNADFGHAIKDSSFFENGDVLIQLEDGELITHGGMLCQRVPFFEAMFGGRTGGQWLAGRRQTDEPEALVHIDLSHIGKETFELVLRHIYAEAEEEIFAHVTSDDLNDHFALDEFLDLVIDVMGVANELMLTRLSQICQRIIGRYVTTRNVCSLLNAIAPCEVTEFKDAALEYICLNIEAILQNGTIDELDDDLLRELDEVVRENQLALLPIARSGRADAELFERYPELAERIDKSKRAKVDAIVMSNKFADFDGKVSTSFRSQSLEEIATSPLQRRNRRKSSHQHAIDEDSPASTPKLRGKASTDLLFDMDGDGDDDVDNFDLSSPSSRKVSQQPSPALRPTNYSLSQRSPAVGSPEPQLSPTLSPSPHNASRPWGPAPALPKKLDMRDIMAQTSNQSSGLSMAFNAHQSRPERPSGSFKLSQKEKKKLQQNSQSSPITLTPARKTAAAGPPASPWSLPKPQAFTPPQPPPRAPTPQLTMRQTIANPSSSKQRSKTHEQAPGTPQTQRSVSGPVQQPSPSIRPQQTSPSTSSPQNLTPRSIRHTPLPSRTASSHPETSSLLAILSQQQLEKDYINTPDKRSIEEIQQEQAFQEWWDAESKKAIREEEDRKRRDKNAARKVVRGRGKGRGRGGGKEPATNQHAGAKATGSEEHDQGSSQPQLQAQPSTLAEEPRPRPKVQRGEGSSRGSRSSKSRGGAGVGRQHSERGKGEGRATAAAQQTTNESAPGP